ncbi:helix-turn-helix domain-containing protein [Rhodococcus rhodnii]|nr:helix-turn-helix transcriptional regulator [Rhodococcus rhodnii]
MRSRERRAVGDFLRRRREELRPEDVGMPSVGRRRVAGLRREEVAALSGVSLDYYQRIEQGRASPSLEIMRMLCDALHLNEICRDYLMTLAADRGPDSADVPHADDVHPIVGHLLANMGHLPAYVVNWRRDVIAWNNLGAALILDFSNLQPHDRNLALIYVRDPRMRTLYAEWEAGGRTLAGQLRAAQAAHPRDARLEYLISELRSTSSDFERWWENHEVAAKSNGTKRLRHDIVGQIDLDYQTFTINGAPDQELFVYVPRRGSREEEALMILGAWDPGATLPDSRNPRDTPCVDVTSDRPSARNFPTEPGYQVR